MFNLFKQNEDKSASRKSFNRLQQLLIDAEQYANEGNTDVAANLLRVLSNDASKMALSFDPPAKLDFENDPDQYVAYLERTVDSIFDAGRELRKTVNERKKPFDVLELNVFEQSELFRKLADQMRKNGCSEQEVAEAALNRPISVEVSTDPVEFGKIVHKSIVENMSTRPDIIGAITTDKGYDIKPEEWGNRSAAWPKPAENRFYHEIEKSEAAINDRTLDLNMGAS